MADEQNQRPYPSNQQAPRRTSAGSAGSDPLAELARLIGQTDPFGEFGRDNARRAAAPPSAPAPDYSPPPLASAAPAYDVTEYFGTTNAPPPAAPYGTPGQAQPTYAEPAYGAAADLYHHDSEVPGYESGYPPHPAADEEHVYDDAPPIRRRMGVMAIAAVFALAVIGTAGALGYRALFGSSSSSRSPPVIKADPAPSKIVPTTASKTPNKLITDRVTDHAQGEKLVSREEMPVAVKDRPAAVMAPQNQPGAQPPNAPPTALEGGGIVTNEPKKIHTIAIRPDQMNVDESRSMAPPGAAPAPVPPPAPIAAPAAQPASNPAPAAHPPAPKPPPRIAETRAPTPVHHAAPPPPKNAPLSLSPNAPPVVRTPTRTASVAAPAAIAPTARASHATGGYAVQVSSQRSEADAQAAFRSLQAKYPNQLGGRQALIHKVELGAKGTYYRAMVGPFATQAEASALCSGLKAAGGQCLIQRN
jgi:SPOR domain